MTPSNDHQRPTDDLTTAPGEPVFEPLRPTSSETAPAAETAADPVQTAVDAVSFTGRTGGRSKLRVGVVSGAAVALAVGAVATSFAASPAPTTSGTTSGTVPSGQGSTSALLAPIVLGEPGGDLGGDVDLGRFGGPGGFREITIAAISGSSITLTTDDGWTRTVTVDGDVELTKGGQAIALGGLAVGDQVRFRQTRNDDGTYTVEAIAVVVPSVRGEVSEVSASGFKVTTRDGSVWTITVDGSTEYQYGQGDGTLADVQDGDKVLVLGESSGDNALRALTVQVAGDRAVGTVQSKTDSTIVIEARDGSTVTLHVDGNTVYRVAGVEDADLGDVAVDMAIGVSGRERADGSIDADAIVAGQGGLGRGRGGPGIFKGPGGRGWGEFDHDASDDGGTATPSPSPSAGS